MIKAKTDSNYFDQFIIQGVDVKNRRIYFGSPLDNEIDGADEVCFASVSVAIRAIDLMLQVSNKPIEIHACSAGGDAYAMLALIDKMMESPCKFIFYGYGEVLSSMSWIMCISDERYLAKNTIVLIHDGSSSVFMEDKTTDSRIMSDESERLQRTLEEIYAENSFMDAKFWQTVCRRDLFLTADEAIKLGLADKIIPYRKRGSFRKLRQEQIPSTNAELKELIANLYQRIKVDIPIQFTVNVRKDESEQIAEYDHSISNDEDKK
jgi:ATP-dependent protease ClpP protease subunit